MSFQQDAKEFAKEYLGGVGVDVNAGYNADLKQTEVMTATRFNAQNDIGGIADVLAGLGISGQESDSVSVQSVENAADKGSDDISR